MCHFLARCLSSDHSDYLQYIISILLYKNGYLDTMRKISLFIFSSSFLKQIPNLQANNWNLCNLKTLQNSCTSFPQVKPSRSINVSRTRPLVDVEVLTKSYVAQGTQGWRDVKWEYSQCKIIPPFWGSSMIHIWRCLELVLMKSGMQQPWAFLENPGEIFHKEPNSSVFLKVHQLFLSVGKPCWIDKTLWQVISRGRTADHHTSSPRTGIFSRRSILQGPSLSSKMMVFFGDDFGVVGEFFLSIFERKNMFYVPGGFVFFSNKPRTICST